MSSESELRSLMHDGHEPEGRPPHDEIDVARVIRRARLRRVPRQLAAGGVGLLVVAGIALPVGVAFSNGGLGVADGAGSLAVEESGGEADTGGQPDGGDVAYEDRNATMSGLAPADKLNLCTAPVAEVTPAENGLVLLMTPVTADAGVASIDTTVTLRNDGTETVTGTTAGSPSLTLASTDGIVLWHSNGPVLMIAVPVDLEPGESMTYTASFSPVECGVEDDVDPAGFRPDLPPLPAGEYSLSAVIDLVASDGSATQLISGPAVPVTLR